MEYTAKYYPDKAKIETEKSVKEIIQILHDHKIPIGLFDEVFYLVKRDATYKTIPYSPLKEPSN